LSRERRHAGNAAWQWRPIRSSSHGNPDPEIAYDLALRTRPDAIVATAGPIFPNQVNNVLGFPFIFGARSTSAPRRSTTR